MLKVLLLSATLFALPLAMAEEPQAVHASAQAGMSININTASAEELAQQLKGVGLSKAKAIVAYREQHGPFTEVAQLTEVKGIGQRTLELNEDTLQL